MTNEPLDLDAIAKRADEATPGPWEPTCVQPRMDGAHQWYIRVGRQPGGLNLTGRQADVEFVAAARTDVPALTARIRELEKHLAEVFHIGMDLGDSDEPPAWRAGTRLRQIAQNALGRDAVHRLAAERPADEDEDEDDLPQDAR